MQNTESLPQVNKLIKDRGDRYVVCIECEQVVVAWSSFYDLKDKTNYCDECVEGWFK